MEEINLQYTTIKDPLPEFIYESLAEYSRGANLYRPQPLVLIEKLASKNNLPKEMIYLTAGIDEAIQMFAKAYGQNAYVFTPSYIVYADVEEFGGNLTKLPSIVGDEFCIKSDTLEGASLIYLANPNNPSGITPKDKVLELIKNNRDSIVVIDEAYGEFADLSVIDQVKNYPNMAVLRSFSKSYGMAGNRVGYIVASPEIINIVKNKTQWSNVSYLSTGAAITALDHEDYFKNIREDINTRRDSFITFLRSHNFTVLPSQINAVLIKFDNDEEGTRFFSYLEQNHIIVSHGNGNSNMGLDKSYVRIAIGTKPQMDVVIKFIENYKR